MTRGYRATYPQRQRATRVADFVVANLKPGERPDALEWMVHIAAAFPGIELEAAIVGLVFRELLTTNQNRRVLQ